ncbi:MAG TPA: hypothetical protein VH591_06250 [Ktedonobacterales bacterium]|jgi:hypothetical protein
MSTRLFRVLAAFAGIAGVVALGYYYSVPFPLPPASATPAQVVQFALHYHDAVFLDTWIQAVGSLLTTVFFLALVFLAGATIRFAGWMTMLASALTLATALAEGTFALAAVQAGMIGHEQTAVTCLDLTNVFVHVFLIVPAPLLLLAVGSALRGAAVLPQVFRFLALALGVAFAIAGFAGWFSAAALTAGIFLLIGQELWVLTAAITLIVRTRKVSGFAS